MRQPSLTRAAVLMTLLALLPATAAAQGRVGGVVRDEAGQPVKGATVTADNANINQSFTATTDDRGRFTMLGLRAGQWRFIAQAPGYSVEAGEMAVRSGSPNQPLTFTLRKTGPSTFGALAGITARDLQADLSAADALFNQQKWDEAIAAYRRIMNRAPALSVVTLQIGAAHRFKKDYGAALAAYDELLKVDPANERAKVEIARTNLERGDAAAAEQVLIKASSEPGAGRDVFYALGELRQSHGDAQGAAGWYEKAAGADPAWGKPLYQLGLQALEAGDRPRATTYLTQVVAVDPASPEAALAKTALDKLGR